ncbi:MAG: helix-turn-helix transcriptional regulator [Chitinophagaceae bacterium]|nr:helix-turn-helix transcriptional regulator [Anaerolineae bacterium]
MTDLPTAYDVLDINCPSRRALALLADKWVMLVIVALSKKEPLRNGELKRMLGNISQKMLVQTLRNLETNGLIVREVFNEVPPHVEYRLSPLGQTLMVPIRAIRDWAQDNVAEIETIREANTSQVSVG